VLVLNAARRQNYADALLSGALIKVGWLTGCIVVLGAWKVDIFHAPDNANGDSSGWTSFNGVSDFEWDCEKHDVRSVLKIFIRTNAQ
jgi:hypothetical protein